MTQTKKAPNQIIRLALILFLVTAITAGVLALVNILTKDRIAAQKAEATRVAYAEVLPTTGNYEEVSFDKTEEFKTVNKISKATDGAGYVVELSFSGAQSTVTAAVGIDAAGVVSGVSIISHAETSGLGAKATEAVFRDQYKGAAEHVALTKNGGTINAISGATITSTAVTNAVNTAMDVVATLG
jgi:electron transport complex protein RnfG